MNKEFTIYGHVDKDGKATIYNKEIALKRLSDGFRKTSIELVFRERFFRFTDSKRGYYYGVILKEMQMAWKATGVLKSISEIDYEFRNKYLYYETLDEETGKFEKTVHTLRRNDTKVSQKMMTEYCEFCIIWAIQNLDWAIPYPNEDFTDNEMTEKQFLYHNGIKENSTF
ncbi:MAG: hypothetical protein ACUZ8H_01630 [Candidatus Anammoxibacter sp.]